MKELPEVLANTSAYPHPADRVEVVETHISWVFIAGAYTYKVKKPVNLGFLDFSSLEKREHFCREELRLNRRLCPDLYLAVVPIVKNGSRVIVGGEGDPIEWALKMRTFDRSQELDRLLAEGKLEEGLVDRIASLAAEFHNNLAPLPVDSMFGSPEAIIKPILTNFLHLQPAANDAGEGALIDHLENWVTHEFQRLSPLMRARKAAGFIRHCHGDMHTGNMALDQGHLLVFDCIEFSRKLSCIDIASDIAFLVMDLEHAGYLNHAWRLLNQWLSLTGDYGSLPLLRFYILYRAMVRAKVTAIRYSQEKETDTRNRTLREHASYLRLAERQTIPGRPALLLTHGVSASGKTTAARRIAQEFGLLHLRSDIERKRLAGLQPLENSDGSIYTQEYTLKTYARLLSITETALREGISVIVDATFLKKSERKRFIALASSLNVPCRILHFEAPHAELEQRLKERMQKGADPSEADSRVLSLQLQGEEPLSAEASRLVINAADAMDKKIAETLATAPERETAPLHCGI